MTISALLAWLITGAGHFIITVIVSLGVAAVLIAAVSHPTGRRYIYGRRRRRVLR
jgi:hypothetical protein